MAGQAELARAEPGAARSHFERADSAFASAHTSVGNPFVRVVAVLPVARENVEVVRAVAAAGRELAAAGRDVSAAVTSLPDGPESLAPDDGVIPVEAITTIVPSLHAGVERLEAGAGQLREAPRSWLVGSVRQGRHEFARVMDSAAESLAAAAAVAEQLPAFLGTDDRKRYLFGAQNPAELRGTGGLMGAYAIMTVKDGRISFGAFDSVHDLPEVAPGQVSPPHASFARRYGRYRSSTDWRNINMTPDLPSAAAAMTRLYERATGRRLDGVVLADPAALAALLRVSGDVTVRGLGSIDADTVVPVVANEAYGVVTDPDERKALLGAVAVRVLEGYLAGPDEADAGEAVKALARAFDGGHLQLYARDPDVQAAFIRAGVAGALPVDPPGDLLAVVANNADGTKVDYYGQWLLRYDVTLLPGGSADTTLTMQMSNHAPTHGQPRYVIGPIRPGLRAGDSQPILSAYCAPGCRLDESATQAGEEVTVGQELGLPVFTTFTTIPGDGGADEVRLAWRTPDAWAVENGEAVYRLDLRLQPTLNPPNVDVSIEIPEGMHLSWSDPPMAVEGESVRWQVQTTGTATATVAFEQTRSLVAQIRQLLDEPAIRVGSDREE